MTEYFILYLIYAVTAFFGAYAPEMDKEKIRRYQNLICFLCLAVLFMLRHQSMGVDLQWKNERRYIGYLPLFDKIADSPVRDLFFVTRKYSYEVGFKIYVKLVSLISKDRQFFIGITSFLCLLPIWKLFDRKSMNPVLSWVIFMGMPPFQLLYSTIRQSLAIGIAALVYMWAEDRKWMHCIIATFVAAMIHSSAVLLILIYPAVNIRTGRKLRIAMMCSLASVWLLKDILISAALKLFPQYSYMFRTEGNAYRFFVILIGIYILMCLSTDESRQQNAYMNLFFLCCAFQMLGMFSNVAARAGYYFSNALCIALPNILSTMKIRENARLIELGTAVSFSAYGLYSIYITDWAQSFPYYWCWEYVA